MAKKDARSAGRIARFEWIKQALRNVEERGVDYDEMLGHLMREWNIGPGAAGNDIVALAQQGYLRENLGRLFYREPKNPEWLPE